MEVPFPPVQQRLMDFIREKFRLGYNHYNVMKLIGDASSRQYFRLVFEDKTSYVLAAYPDPFDPKHFNYSIVYELLRSIGLPVPEIIGLSGDSGIVLQEDLGDESLLLRLRTGPEEQRDLLCEAIDHLIVIQTEGSQAAHPDTDTVRLAFDREKLTWELNFFRRYYGAYRKLDLMAREEWSREIDRLAEELASYPRFLCHRDYHVRNLMVKNQRLYIIDFQDARQGPASYDLVSLLKDSIQLSDEDLEWFVGYYLRTSRSMGSPALLPETEFRRQFHLMSIQRLLKALGTYGYQITQRGNFIYEQYVAGSLYRAGLALRLVREFPYIQSFVEDEVACLQAKTGSPLS